MQPNLEKFISAALEKQIARSEIKSALLQSGWSSEEIESGLSEYAELNFAVPVPTRKPYLSARETFTHLITFLCLYLSTWSFGDLIFFFINKGFPDVLNPYETSPEILRIPLAMLIIAFPIFFGLTLLDRTKIKKDPVLSSSKIRKWLTYITLFVAAAVIIADLIVLLYNLLGGEFETRFILKVATVMIITLGIFGYYYFGMLKLDEEKHEKG